MAGQVYWGPGATASMASAKRENTGTGNTPVRVKLMRQVLI